MNAFETIYLDEVSAKAVTVYRYLLDRQGNHGFCYVSHKKIARDNKCSVSAVKRAVRELQQKGYLTKTSGRRSDGSQGSNIYVCRKP